MTDRRLGVVVVGALAVAAGVTLWALFDAASDVWRAVQEPVVAPAAPPDRVARRAAEAADTEPRDARRSPELARERRREARAEWRAKLSPEERVELREERRERRAALDSDALAAQQQRKVSNRVPIEPSLRFRPSTGVPDFPVPTTSAPAAPFAAEPAPEPPADQVTNDDDLR